MPYYITNEHPDCPKWAVVKSDFSVVACHGTKTEAIAQMVAISQAEDIEPGGTFKIKREVFREAVDGKYQPPEGVQNAAKRALRWISEGKAGKGFTSVGRRRAQQLASGKAVTRDTVARMRSYFGRHTVDKKAEGFNAGEKGFPSPGRVAWDAWGGDAGKAWVNRLKLD